MITAVFTGWAHDAYGQTIVRRDLTAAAAARGIDVQGRVNSETTVLVASRKDTVKARRAKSNGIPVLTYPQFIEQYLDGVSVPCMESEDSVSELHPASYELGVAPDGKFIDVL